MPQRDGRGILLVGVFVSVAAVCIVYSMGRMVVVAVVDGRYLVGNAVAEAPVVTSAINRRLLPLDTPTATSNNPSLP